MAATMEDWFASSVKPDASVAEYMTAPPRGMTNPPQNPKVRAMLLKELNEQGVQLEPAVWPPPLPPVLRPQRPGLAQQLQLDLRIRRSPSCPAVFGGQSCAARHPPSLPGAKRKARGPADDKRKKTAAEALAAKQGPAAVEPRKAKYLYSAELDKHEKSEVTVLLERTGTSRLGVVEYGGHLLAHPEHGTLFYQWNKENPDELVKPDDRIVEVNRCRDNLQQMTKQLRKHNVWEIKLRRAWDKSADVLGQSHGTPTARWHTKAPFIFEGVSIGAAASKAPSKPRGAAPPVEKEAHGQTRAPSRPGTSSGSKEKDDGKGWLHPSQMKITNRTITEEELKNARASLKGQSGLHTAAVADRFKYAADMSKGAPMCIRGSGTPSSIPSDVWASDASVLIKFHNNAIRLVSPSTLQPLPDPPPQKKKRKKNADDDDELQMGESGLFKPRYPLDRSLSTLRRLKNKIDPDAGRREREEIERRARLLADMTAPIDGSGKSFLGSSAGGFGGGDLGATV